MITLKYLTLTAVLLVATVWDLKTYRIPNPLVLTGFGLGVLYQLIGTDLPNADVLTGLLVVGGTAIWLYSLSRKFHWVMGGGDVKVIIMLSVYLGLQRALLAVVISHLLQVTLSVLIGLWQRRGLARLTLPLMPAMLIAVLVVVYGPQRWMNWLWNAA